MQSGDIQWLSEQQFTDNLADPIALNFSLTGYEGSLSWLMPKEDLVSTIADLLTHTKDSTFQPDNELLHSFYRFLAIEAIHIIGELEYDNELSIHLLDTATLPKEAALAMDVAIHLQGKRPQGAYSSPPSLESHGRGGIPQNSLRISCARLCRKNWISPSTSRRARPQYHVPSGKRSALATSSSSTTVG